MVQKEKYQLPPRGLNDACAAGDTKAAEKLLGEVGVNYKDPAQGGSTGLLAAATNGKDAVLRLLLEKGASPDGRNNGGHTALMCAARNGKAASVEILLDAGADWRMFNQELATAEDYAVQMGHNTVVCRLRQVASASRNSAEVDVEDAIKSRDLHALKTYKYQHEEWLPSHKDFVLAVQMRDAAARVPEGEVEDPLAAHEPSFAIIRWFLRLRPGLVAGDPSNSLLPLHVAVASRDYPVTSLLLASGADAGLAAHFQGSARQLTPSDVAVSAPHHLISLRLAVERADLAVADVLQQKRDVEPDDRQAWVSRLRAAKTALKEATAALQKGEEGM